MPAFMKWILLLLSLASLSQALNVLSYRVLKRRILRQRKWDLNIGCGKTDGGGGNADIVAHAGLPNFRLIDSGYHLPFEENQFETVLASHTMEHVDEPAAFFKELTRVGKQ